MKVYYFLLLIKFLCQMFCTHIRVYIIYIINFINVITKFGLSTIKMQKMQNKYLPLNRYSIMEFT